MYKIQFIVIDGLDASGKTTQARRLVKFLQNQGKAVCLRVHPSDDNFLGANAKRFLQASGSSAHFASALFYMLDVLHSIVKYRWRDYDYIIFVRYLMGTAYLPSPMDKIAYCFFSALVPKPEKMLFIDIKPEDAYKRIVKRTRDTIEMFENPEALAKVREKGIALTTLGKWLVIDGSRPQLEVELLIRNLLKPE
ncbi:MAG: thymidylate kinase [Candidatus Bathyarchaeota archaeon]|nr:thymidylate kinase [Candidatus Bathyarchaeota archaeon]